MRRSGDQHSKEKPRKGYAKGARLRRRPLHTDTDDGHEAAGKGAFAAVAEEKVGAAGGAKFAREDILSTQAGGEKLRAIGFE